MNGPYVVVNGVVGQYGFAARFYQRAGIHCVNEDDEALRLNCDFRGTNQRGHLSLFESWLFCSCATGVTPDATAPPWPGSN